jgi:hypothetical protein
VPLEGWDYAIGCGHVVSEHFPSAFHLHADVKKKRESALQALWKVCLLRGMIHRPGLGWS